VKVARFVPLLRSPLQWPLRGRTNLRNHRKLVVADGRRMWSGGRNLSGEYFEGRDAHQPWVDLSFDLEGDVASQAAAVFDSDWNFALSPAREEMGVASGRSWPSAPVQAPAAQLLPSGPDGYAAGDRVGLRKLGRPAGCIAVPPGTFTDLK